MPTEPASKRVFVYVDGQNLFHSVKDAFGYSFPNYDVFALSNAICNMQSGWVIGRVRMYTGVPDATDNRHWHQFWTAKLAAIGKKPGATVFSRPLRYRNQTVKLPDGTTTTLLVGQEKGIDIRIALDVVHDVRTQLCDVVLLLSQDQDLSEVADEIRAISKDQDRWIKIASAFPSSPASRNKRGVNKTDWIKIERSTYDKCIDRIQYGTP